jgi:hypothetical protein
VYLARAGLIALALAAGCLTSGDGARIESELDAYRGALSRGDASSAPAEAIARAELARLDEPERAAAGRALALRYHGEALASRDPAGALARDEVAYALLDRTCPDCARQRIPVLLNLARIYAERGERAGLARCAERARSLAPHGLEARNLSDWPLLRRLAELQELLGDFAAAARIERGILDAKLQILDASHPQVAASRERIAELERRAAEERAASEPAP